MPGPSGGRATASRATSTSTTTRATRSGARPLAFSATIWPLSRGRPHRDGRTAVAGRSVWRVPVCATRGIRTGLALLAVRAQRRRSAFCEVSARAGARVPGLRVERRATGRALRRLALHAARAPALHEIALDGREEEH